MSLEAAHLLTRDSHRRVPAMIRLAGDLTLAAGRVHEFCGPARRTLALWVAAGMQGPVFWIVPAWCRARLNPCGYPPGLDPARLIHVEAPRADDLLWSMEESLRAGVVPLVVADLPDPVALTPVRRLHLAAEAGAASSGIAPLGLMLTPEGASAGIETRWSLAPRHTPDREAWRLDRLRARMAPPASWTVTAQGTIAPIPA
ncbi:hypothetical protein E2L08_08755 [Palleronia sediminis]|uniref:Protein ImuA n=1 Tax=Palleronia sediminis TaxID=2547833 RepID=A0A4R6AE06_9RHOB|nr:hypothetical protein [Palleronia sediminis]TDL79686.1 hypothetical protein E2L08_08755 [Palleronia sediminis]